MKKLPNFKEITKSSNGKINRPSTQRESLDLKLTRIQRLDLLSHRGIIISFLILSISLINALSKKNKIN